VLRANTNKRVKVPEENAGRECLIVCLWGYATLFNDHSTLARHDRGRIHPNTVSFASYS
jgi:hypothetical protein